MAESMKTVRFTDLWRAWPIVGSSEMGAALGGDVERLLLRPSDDASSPPLRDDSSIRLCAAFARVGRPVPTTGSYTGIEVKDKYGFHYVPGAPEMKKLLDTTFPHAKKHIRGKEDAVGRRGILLFEGVKSLHGDGHVDLWDGTQTAEARGDLWTDAESTHLYVLD
jgi:hypothetical protein